MKLYPTRPAVYRLARIHAAIAAGDFPNARTLAKAMEVSERSVLRDVEYLRDVLGEPIGYDAVRHGYFFTGPSNGVPGLTLSEGELVGLLIGSKVLEQYAGNELEVPLRRAFEKMCVFLPDEVSVRVGELAGAMSFRCSAPRPADAERFRALLEAVTHRRRLVIRYRGLGDRVARERVVDPYHLACVDGGWYLLAHCDHRAEVRMFVPERMEDIRATGETFEKPSGFDPAQYLSGAFKVMVGDRPRIVRVKFVGAMAAYVAERRWHASQKLTRTNGGNTCVIEITVSNLAEVAAWVMSFGGQCRVLAPRELRDQVAVGHWRGLEMAGGVDGVKAKAVGRAGKPGA